MACRRRLCLMLSRRLVAPFLDFTLGGVATAGPAIDFAMAEIAEGATCALALYDFGADPDDQSTALRELERAILGWKTYAALRDARHVSAVYNRLGTVDLTTLTAKIVATC